MKLSKFLSFMAFATFFSLLYVYQQTEIFRYAYEGQKRQASFQDLLDKNTLLRYNIESSVSLVRLGSKISQSQDFEIPGSFTVVQMRFPEGNLKLAQPQAARQNLIARFFSIKREAQAETLSP